MNRMACSEDQEVRPERPESQKQQRSVASSLHQALEFPHLGRGGHTQLTLQGMGKLLP